ncbi:DUF2461 domain-containing protein [Mucilaginibacter sp. McL0603]|uniref:DUF2461 domain-containing protein n=1 Tax=Mucilaginibacter sp. McL0603 TaxID=3415670 RepID=UPI003CECC1B7
MPASGFAFLSELKNNNNREWFDQHKSNCLQEMEYVGSFAEAVIEALNTHDVIETKSGKKSLWRIYRDTRFSKDKTPYKTHWGGHFTRAGHSRRGGYYYHLEPGNSYVLGGFNAPNAQDLKRIREDIAYDDRALREILNSEAFRASFGSLRGGQLKTSPKGFDPEHPANDLLRYKQFLLIQQFSTDEVMSKGFVQQVSQAYKNMRPFFDYMSEVLTADVNGLAI